MALQPSPLRFSCNTSAAIAGAGREALLSSPGKSAQGGLYNAYYGQTMAARQQELGTQPQGEKRRPIPFVGLRSAGCLAAVVLCIVAVFGSLGVMWCLLVYSTSGGDETATSEQRLQPAQPGILDYLFLQHPQWQRQSPDSYNKGQLLAEDGAVAELGGMRYMLDSLRKEVSDLHRRHTATEEAMTTDLRHVEANVKSLMKGRSAAGSIGSGQPQAGSCVSVAPQWQREGLVDWAAWLNGGAIHHGHTSPGIGRSWFGRLTRVMAVVVPASSLRQIAADVSPPPEVMLANDGGAPVRCFSFNAPGKVAVSLAHPVLPVAIAVERLQDWASSHGGSAAPRWVEVRAATAGAALDSSGAIEASFPVHLGTFEYEWDGSTDQTFDLHECPVPVQTVLFAFNGSWSAMEQTEVCRLRVLAPVPTSSSIQTQRPTTAEDD